MKKLLAAVALAAMALTGFATVANAAPAGKVQVGVLTCEVDPGVGFIIGSDKSLTCSFKPSKGGKTEHYSGSIKKLGLDIGFTVGSKIAWLVFAAEKNGWAKHPGTIEVVIGPAMHAEGEGPRAIAELNQRAEEWVARTLREMGELPAPATPKADVA